MFSNRMRRNIFRAWLGLMCALFGAGAFGCGVPNQQVSLRLERRALVEISTFRLWVIKDKLTDGKAISCAELLKGTSFDPAKFDKEKDQTIKLEDLQDNKEEITASELSTGKKLFVGAGYDKAAEDKDPAAIGCSEGEIKSGERLFISIFLANRK